ncbi:MAG: hypothetical protein QW607_05600 [Desulfurococcaceae archaeon]
MVLFRRRRKRRKRMQEEIAKRREQAERVQAYASKIEELQKRTPKISQEDLQKYLIRLVEPATVTKLEGMIEAQAKPAWGMAQKAGEEIARIAVPHGTSDVAKYFAEKFREYVTRVARETYERSKPRVYEDIRKIVQTVTSPQASVVYGMTREHGKWSGLDYGEQTGEIVKQLEEMRKSYSEMIEQLNRYFRDELGISNFDANKLFEMTWG